MMLQVSNGLGLNYRAGERGVNNNGEVQGKVVYLLDIAIFVYGIIFDIRRFNSIADGKLNHKCCLLI